jgi:hypothetical protein
MTRDDLFNVSFSLVYFNVRCCGVCLPLPLPLSTTTGVYWRPRRLQENPLDSAISFSKPFLDHLRRALALPNPADRSADERLDRPRPRRGHSAHRTRRLRLRHLEPRQLDGADRCRGVQEGGHIRPTPPLRRDNA